LSVNSVLGIKILLENLCLLFFGIGLYPIPQNNKHTSPFPFFRRRSHPFYAAWNQYPFNSKN
jgi:hypothetical protein